MSVRVKDILAKKQKTGISVLTAYDYPMACLLDQAGVDMILIGDSLGNVVLGQEGTLGVSLADMVHHGKAVCRGVKNALTIMDMPFGSYQVCRKEAVRHACFLIAQTGAQSVKLEGGRSIAKTIRSITEAGIPVVGHVGLKPQSVHAHSGYRMTGKDSQEAEMIFEDAEAVEKAGAFAVVLECVDSELAIKITESLSIPTIGIGSGAGCDGQVLVSYDMLGYTQGHVPKFVKQRLDLNGLILEAIKGFVHDTQHGK